MSEKLRFAEAVCAGHPDRLADTIAERVVGARHARATRTRSSASRSRSTGTSSSWTAASPRGGRRPPSRRARSWPSSRQAFADAGYGRTASGVFRPEPGELEVRTDLCLGPLPEEERAIRDVSDDQSICVGHAVWGPRAGHRPLEQALASDFAAALERLRVDRPDLGLGPDGKTLVVVRGRALVGVSLSIQHAPGIDWVALTREARAACDAIAAEYVDGGELEPLGPEVDWLVNGAGAFEVGGPEGDNGLSGKKLVAQAYGSAVPIGGGATCGKDPRKVDPRGPGPGAASSRSRPVCRGNAREATVWLAYRPGDLTPRWVEVVEPPGRRPHGRRASSTSGRAPRTPTGRT